MWKQIQDCGKQLTIGCKIRQTAREGEDVHVTEYNIQEIEVAEYKLNLVFKSKNGLEVPADPNEVVVLTCEQVIHYQFDVWVEIDN